ncbi:MAG TPA: response regulator transcription factor [Alphaproteobacteria bacterium]|jgi:two-component system nitrate/nitrite response regulator NarL|nr:response regulator transcription factor [Alphaproteobacteria bacterium]
MTEPRLILAGESGLFRDGLKRVLADRKLSVIAEAASLTEALAALRASKRGADLVVWDRTGAAAGQFDVLKQIVADFPKTKVVILAERIEAAEADLAAQAGASGLLPKNLSGAALGLSLELVTLGENLFTAPASLWRHTPLPPAEGLPPPAPISKDTLTHRQRQILEYLEAGLSNRAIASKLDVAEATVKVHVRALLTRINVDNRTQAALWAKSQK